MLENAGDIATRFQWNQRTIGDLFTCVPLEGAPTTETEIAFDVTFSQRRSIMMYESTACSCLWKARRPCGCPASGLVSRSPTSPSRPSP